MIYLNPTPYPTMPLCDACGCHPVARKGMLCNDDSDDGLWLCAFKAAQFANRWYGLYRKQKPAWADYVEVIR